MIALIRLLFAMLVSPFKSRSRLEAEIAALRQQLIVLRRKAKVRAKLTNGDRWFFVQLYRLFPSILEIITIIQPETLLHWHRAGFRRYWRWKSGGRGGRPQIQPELRALIRRMSAENRLWGAPRIHGELLKLGFEVSQSTVAKYMARRRGPPSQGWHAFLANHAPHIAAMDLFVVPTISFTLLYAFVIVRLDRRTLVWTNVTRARYEVRLIGAKVHALDELLPMLQNLGLRVADQIQFALNLSIGPRFIRSFIVEPSMRSGASVARSYGRLLEALKAVLSAEVESDALNGLVLVTELDWRQIDLFRAYSNYYQQLGLRIERTRIYRALLYSPASNSSIVTSKRGSNRIAVDANSFEIELESLTPIRAQLVDVLDKVTDSGDDRILRDLFNLIDATVRTNFYFCGDWARKLIALKISSLGVFNMPAPKPMAEIYVHSPSITSLHTNGS